MEFHWCAASVWLISTAWAFADDPVQLVRPRSSDGDGEIQIGGELKQWHKVTLTLNGPFAHERDQQPNPFTDYLMKVRFTHESGQPDYVVQGYFAADGDAANSSLQSGVKWRAHLSPDKPGRWTYRTSFAAGLAVAVEETAEAITDGRGLLGIWRNYEEMTANARLIAAAPEMVEVVEKAPLKVAAERLEGLIGADMTLGDQILIDMLKVLASDQDRILSKIKGEEQ